MQPRAQHKEQASRMGADSGVHRPKQSLRQEGRVPLQLSDGHQPGNRQIYPMHTGQWLSLLRVYMEREAAMS